MRIRGWISTHISLHRHLVASITPEWIGCWACFFTSSGSPGSGPRKPASDCVWTGFRFFLHVSCQSHQQDKCHGPRLEKYHLILSPRFAHRSEQYAQNSSVTCPAVSCCRNSRICRNFQMPNLRTTCCLLKGHARAWIWSCIFDRFLFRKCIKRNPGISIHFNLFQDHHGQEGAFDRNRLPRNVLMLSVWI